jgi:tetratricopeptide (TPR) repeat protein
MSNEGPLLVELRKISAWADTQRKVTKWSMICAAVILPAAILFAILMEQRVSTQLEDSSAGESPDWYEVDQNVRRGDLDKAIQIGEALIGKTPQYPEAHRRLAGAYLAAGRIEEAKKHYEEAFRLFPSDENEKLVAAIRKRIQAEDTHAAASGDKAVPARADTDVTPTAAASRR